MDEPKTIIEWLNEQISFIEGELEMTKDKDQYVDLKSKLGTFSFCKRLYNELMSDPADLGLKRKFEFVAHSLIEQAIFLLDIQQYEPVMYVGRIVGVNRCTKQVLSDEETARIKRMRDTYESLYDQINDL